MFKQGPGFLYEISGYSRLRESTVLAFHLIVKSAFRSWSILELASFRQFGSTVTSVRVMSSTRYETVDLGVQLSRGRYFSKPKPGGVQGIFVPFTCM